MKELGHRRRIFSTANSAAGSVLATLVTVEGSSYRRPGARLLVKPDGTRIGSISGGCLEEDVLARAQGVAKTGCAGGGGGVRCHPRKTTLVWGVGPRLPLGWSGC